MAVKSNLVVAHFSKSSAVIQEGSSLSYLLNRHTTPPIFNFRGSGRDRVYTSPHNFYKESEKKNWAHLSAIFIFQESALF